MVKAIVAVILATVLVSVIGAGVAMALLESGEDIEENAIAYTIALIPSMILVELFLLGAAVWFGPRKYKLTLAALGLRKPDIDTWSLPLALAIVGLLLVYGYEGATTLIGIEDSSTPDAIFESAGPFVVVIVGAVLLAPVIEELFFRGFIFEGIRRRRGWVQAAMLSSILFAIAHLSLYAVPPFTAIGLLFAWAYRYAGSLKAPIIAHAAINTVTISITLVSSGTL